MSILDKFLGCFGFYRTLGARINRWKRRPRRQPEVIQTPVSPTEMKPIEFLINDMTTPGLTKTIEPPVAPQSPKFAVKSYSGGGHKLQSEAAQAANCYVSITNTLNYFNSMSDKPVPRWAGTSTLYVIPRSGVDLNAYYDRRSLQFFYATHPKINGTFFTVDSTDIVTHELGHAILDAYRPDTWSAMSLEVASIHEAFADFTAIMHIMQYDEALHHALNETAGNLKMPSVLSNLAEHFGQALYKLTGDSIRNPNCLRSAINDFKYVNPGTLPSEAPDDQLAAECHSFGRIFLGAFWDIYVMMYEDMLSTNMEPVTALKAARDLLTRYTLKAIQNAPLNTKFCESMARTMLWADVTLSNWKYHNRMQEIFMNRNLMSPQVMMLSAPKCDNNECVIKTGGKMNLKLGDVLIRAQSDNPLYDVEIEIPCEEVFLYDNDKNLYDTMRVSEDVALGAAQDMITFLHNTGSVSDDPRKPFEIRDGKLVRTCIS